MACVEGEWHSLPARMAAEILRVRGWDVTFLGASLPADDLARYVESQQLSLPAALDALLESVEDRVPAGRQVVEESRRR